MPNESIPPRAQLRNYTRWTRTNAGLVADILGERDPIIADPSTGYVAYGDRVYSPDEARMVGVRLIEGAALADGDRAIRQAATS